VFKRAKSLFRKNSSLPLSKGLASNVILRNEVTKNLVSEEVSRDSSLRSE